MVTLNPHSLAGPLAGCTCCGSGTPYHKIEEEEEEVCVCFYYFSGLCTGTGYVICFAVFKRGKSVTKRLMDKLNSSLGTVQCF